MPALINFPIDLGRTASALEQANKLLLRIAEALDRIAPPPLAARGKQYQAQLSDLRYTDHQSTAPIREELGRFAEEHSVAINSEAFLNSIIQYERDIGAVYGAEAILELPWNKAAGGALFAEDSNPQKVADERGAGTQEAPLRAVEKDREPSTRS